MNLILRPLNDVNDVTWSIIWCMVILLFGVGYYIVYIMKIAYRELEMDSVDRQTEEILKEWEEDAAKYYEQPTVEEGLDIISISTSDK